MEGGLKITMNNSKDYFIFSDAVGTSKNKIEKEKNLWSDDPT